MSGRLRRWLDRPLAEGDRGRHFLVVLGVLVLAGAGFVATRSETKIGRSAQVATSPAAAERTDDTFSEPAPSPAPSATGTPTPDPPPNEEGEPEAGAASGFTPASGRAVRRAARAFLAGYLPYTYGQGKAAEIERVSPALRRTLAKDQPRVPTGERKRRPKVELVSVMGGGRAAATSTAMVDDGRRRYSVALRLARAGASAWRVVEVSG